MPRIIDGQYDDSDYVAAQGTFQPGSMLCDDSGNMISAGVLVEKDDQRRLTVSIHCWQKELDESLEKMGDPGFFRVTQGKTHVGHVSSKLGTSDIGLATLNENVEFRNRFINIPGGPTQLLHSDKLKSNQVYMIDRFTTGRQGQLLCKGKRIIRPQDKERRVDQVLRDKQKDLPETGRYLVLVQGILLPVNPWFMVNLLYAQEFAAQLWYVLLKMKSHETMGRAVQFQQHLRFVLKGSNKRLRIPAKSEGLCIGRICKRRLLILTFLDCTAMRR